MRHVADHVGGQQPAIHFDTCTAAGTGGCRSLWGGRRTIVDCAVAVGSPVRRLAFAGLMGARAAYRYAAARSEEHTSELQSLMRISYAVFCLTKHKQINNPTL